MRLTLRRVFAFAVFAAMPLGPSGATTYQAVADEVLADRADLVAEVRVIEQLPGSAPGMPSTDYRVEVERLVAGAAVPTTLVVNVPGGVRPGGRGLHLWGVPAFGAGERALLFLRDAGDGTYRILHLALGSFRPTAAGDRTLAVRDLSEARVVTLDGEAPPEGGRDFERFVAWVADRARGDRREADYWVPATGLRNAVAPYTFMQWEGTKIRWFEFDESKSVPWRAHSSGQAGLSGGGFNDFQAALGAWNADTPSNVAYSYAGQTGATTGFDDVDGINAILFNETLDSEYDCSSGGVLAVGGPWFDSDDTGVYNGETYIRAIEADILTNRGLECFFQNSLTPNLTARELFGHELGHTLGIGHSCGDGGSGSCGSRGSVKEDALMKASIHNDGRGARLNEDDRGAVRALYTRQSGGGGKKLPNAPTNLVASALSATSVHLVWADKSGNEANFHVEQRVGATGELAEVAVLAANVKTVTLTGLLPSTAYGFRVHASNQNGNSAPSNEATVTTPSLVPAAPTNLRADHAGALVVLTWTDRSADESLFAIEAKSPQQGVYVQVATAGANVETFSLSSAHIATGVPYTFRVRALAPTGNSAYSNEASATLANVSACVPSATDLCLGASNRFRVRVEWRTANGATGVGGAIPDGNPQTGFFWFFDPSNVELAVKVLDGTSVNDFYWTFYGALSDVQYWLTVSDTVTLESRTYYNPQGSFVGQADIRSLPSAPAPHPLPAIPVPSCTVPVPVDSTTTPGTCAAGANTLCLLDGRFKVEVGFAAGGLTGQGAAIPFAGGQSGRFWFFGADNVELLVKILDGEAINGKYWIFYGALSDVEYTLRVTDTATGNRRSYTNPQGNFCGRADIAAFPH